MIKLFSSILQTDVVLLLLVLQNPTKTTPVKSCSKITTTDCPDRFQINLKTIKTALKKINAVASFDSIALTAYYLSKHPPLLLNLLFKERIPPPPR